MFLHDFENYTSQYEQGMKKVFYRSGRPKLNHQKNDLKLEKSHGNYYLVFNREGLLLHSFHSESNKNYKVIYGYNPKGIITTVMKLLSEVNELISISLFEYDENGRISKETVRSFYYMPDYEVTEEWIYTYHENKDLILIKNNEEDDLSRIFIYYDDKKRVIEEKIIRNDDEVLCWFKNEYDEENNLIKEISLGEDGEPDGVYEYFPESNRISKGYEYKSKNTNYLREYSYTFDDKGNWINQVVIDNGVPEYFYERSIEYY
jgi:hypothetical protein